MQLAHSELLDMVAEKQEKFLPKKINLVRQSG